MSPPCVSTETSRNRALETVEVGEDGVKGLETSLPLTVLLRSRLWGPEREGDWRVPSLSGPEARTDPWARHPLVLAPGPVAPSS